MKEVQIDPQVRVNLRSWRRVPPMSKPRRSTDSQGKSDKNFPEIFSLTAELSLGSDRTLLLLNSKISNKLSVLSGFYVVPCSHATLLRSRKRGQCRHWLRCLRKREQQTSWWAGRLKRCQNVRKHRRKHRRAGNDKRSGTIPIRKGTAREKWWAKRREG